MRRHLSHAARADCLALSCSIPAPSNSAVMSNDDSVTGGVLAVGLAARESDTEEGVLAMRKRYRDFCMDVETLVNSHEREKQ